MSRPIYFHRLISIPFLALLAACASNNLSASLPLLKGKPIAEAIRYLGPPDQENKLPGQTVYTWINYETGTYSVPATGLTPVISSAQGQPIVTYTRTDFPSREESYVWSCHLTIMTEKGIIVRSEYEAGGAGCHRFSEKLRPLAESAGKKK